MKITTKLAIGVIALTVTLFGCRKSPDQKDYDDEKDTSSTIAGVGGGTVAARDTINIPLMVDYAAFSLATPATAYSVTLDGCLSGYTDTVTEANLDGVEVYKDDRNCLAKLTSFTVGGKTYTNVAAGATDFTTWLAGDTATFSDGTDTLGVQVASQLDSPITGTEAIVYNFSDILDAASDNTVAEADVSDAHAITVEGIDPPQFKLKAVTFQSMDDITGAPEFIFKLECVDDATSGAPTSQDMTTGIAANSLCGTIDLDDIDYKLILDTYGSVMTAGDADAVFATAGDVITMPTDQYQDIVDSEEGFNTVVLDGPGGLGTPGNENMILILNSGGSYTYYNVDVTTIAQ